MTDQPSPVRERPVQPQPNTPLDPDAMFAALEEKLSQQSHPMDIGRIRAAYDVAKTAHSGQKRKDGSPYVTHCVAAADRRKTADPFAA